MPIYNFTDKMYNRIAKRDAWSILLKVSKKNKQLGTFIDFWSQVLNGGLKQWCGNRYVSINNYDTVINNIKETVKYSKKYGNKFNSILTKIEKLLDGASRYLPISVQEGNFSIKDFDSIFDIDVDDVGYEEYVGRSRNNYDEEEDDDDEYNEDDYEIMYDAHDVAAVKTFNEVEEQFDKLDSEMYNIPDDFIQDILDGIKSKSKITFSEIVEEETGINMEKLLKDFKIVRESGKTNMFDMNSVLDIAKAFQLKEITKLTKMKKSDARNCILIF